MSSQLEILPRQNSPEETRRSAAITVERRKRVRTAVHWPVRFWGDPLTHVVESVTHDLSSDGFYCFSKIPFVPGERVNCTLQVPERCPSGQYVATELECRVEIMRVEPASETGHLGIACRIEEYRVVRTAAAAK